MVRIQHSQYEMNYPIDVGLLRCFSDVCRDYDDVFRLVRDVHRQYHQQRQDLLPQPPPYPTHSPSSLAGGAIVVRDTSPPTGSPTLLDFRSNATEGISLPIKVPEKPPKIPPLPPLPSPVVPPSITIVDDHSDPSQVAANQLIDRATLRKIVRPFEMASRMTLLFLAASAALSLVVVAVVVADAVGWPVYRWYWLRLGDAESAAMDEEVCFASGARPRTRRHPHRTAYRSVAGDERRCQGPSPGQPQPQPQPQLPPPRALLPLRGVEDCASPPFAAFRSLSEVDRRSPASSAASTATLSEAAHGRTTPLRRPADRHRSKHSPTRVCTPPDLSLLSDCGADPPAAAPQPTVRDLVHFYESPVKQRGLQFTAPPPSHQRKLSSYQTERDENAAAASFDVETGREGRAVWVAASAGAASGSRFALHWPAGRAAAGSDEEISDSETGSVLRPPGGSGDDDSDDGDGDGDGDVALLEAQTRTMWRAIARYRRLNMALVASLLLLFVALVAYMSFTAPNMGRRGSYYREAVWLVMYATMAALFTTLRVAVAMLDEQQDWYDKRMFYAKCLRRLARRSRRR